MRQFIHDVIVVAAASAVALAAATPAAATTSWTYTPGSPGTITDGSNWTLNVSNPNDTAQTLTLGNGTANNNIYVAGSGSLDLGDVVCCTSGGTNYVITALTQKGFYGNKAVTNLALPSLIRMIPSGFAGGGCTITGDLARIVHPAGTSIGYQAFRDRYQAVQIKGDVVLTNLVSIDLGAFDGSGLTSVTLSGPISTFATEAFARTPLTNFVFNTPNLTVVADNVFNGCGSLGGKISLTNLTSMGSGIFGTCFKLQEVRLQSATLTTLPASTFYACYALTNVVLDLPALTSLASRSLATRRTLGDLVICASNAFTIASDVAYDKDTTFSRITFLGKAPDRAALGNLVANTASGTSTHGCTFFVSKNQAGWNALASPLLETETPNAPAKCFGVYTNNLGRKAWMVNQASPYDPKGTFIVIQ